jgi:hypothetical protein
MLDLKGAGLEMLHFFEEHFCFLGDRLIYRKIGGTTRKINISAFWICLDLQG